MTRRKIRGVDFEMYTHTPRRDVNFLKTFYITSLFMFLLAVALGALSAL